MVSFEINNSERELIAKIVERALPFAEPEVTRMDLTMDVTACHANGCRLRLNDLLKADKFNLLHDVFGIHAKLNRNTGKLGDHFTPRFADTSDTSKFEFEFAERKGGLPSKYMVNRATGECFTWIERRQRASGWQKLKCSRRIKAVSKAAIAAFSAAIKA